MNELYFSKGKVSEIDASKWKVALPAVHLALLLTFLFQGAESAIMFGLPELTVQSDDLIPPTRASAPPSHAVLY